MLKSSTKFKKFGGSTYILLPPDILSDSQYPFVNDEEIVIVIVDDKLIIKRRSDVNEQNHILLENL